MLRAAERAAALAQSMQLAVVSRDEKLSMPRAPEVSRDAASSMRLAEESPVVVALPVAAVVEPHAAAQPRWGVRVRAQRGVMVVALTPPAPPGCVTECPAMGLLRQQGDAEVHPPARAMRVPREAAAAQAPVLRPLLPAQTRSPCSIRDLA